MDVQELYEDWCSRKENFVAGDVRAWTGANSEVGRFLASLLPEED